MLRTVADSAILERGRGYGDDGLVEFDAVTGDAVTATVRGTAPYRVELASRGGGLTWACTCPDAGDGRFCTYLAAAALSAAASAVGERDGAAPEAGGSDVVAWLERQHHADLVALLAEAVDRHPDLRRDLEAQAAAAQHRPPHLERYEGDLADAFATGGFVPWRDVGDWAGDVHAALDGVAELLDAGFGGEAVHLAERGLAELEQATGHVDDAGGELAAIGGRLVDLHLAALRRADDPDQAEAGRRVFALAASGEIDVLRERLGE